MGEQNQPMCLVGGSRCWLKGLDQIQSVSWIFHHSLHFTFIRLSHLCQVPGSTFIRLSHLCPLYCYYKRCRWDRWEMIDLCQGVGGETGSGYYLIAIVFLTWAVVFCSLMSSVSFFKWLEHDSCCVCFFVYCLFSLSLVPLTRSYWGIEIVVSVM